MQKVQFKISNVIILSGLLLLAPACGPEPRPISQITPVPPGVEVVNIMEAETVNSEITQRKTFNQCDSASPFRAQIQFSESSSQANQQELVLKASAAAEAGISQLAKLKLEGAIEQHFASSSASGQGHQEGVVIEVPPRTQQEYTIIWREIRREGTVQYVENGESKAIDYSYRIGLELVSSTVRDILCTGQEKPQATSTQLSIEPYHTNTSEPVATELPPIPTGTPYINTAPPPAIPTTVVVVPTPLPLGGAIIGALYSDGIPAFDTSIELFPKTLVDAIGQLHGDPDKGVRATPNPQTALTTFYDLQPGVYLVCFYGPGTAATVGEIEIKPYETVRQNFKWPSPTAYGWSCPL